MPYLIDANVLLQAKNTHYGLDFCPAFWRWITDSHAAGQVFSIGKVRDELKDPDISRWVAAQPKGLFLGPANEIPKAMALLAAWVHSQHYTRAAIDTFLASADCHLIAHAMVGEHTLVSHEVASNSPNRIKIPNACAAMGVVCVSPYRMLRELKARFVIGPLHEPYEGAGLAGPAPTAPVAAEHQRPLMRRVGS